ncbi:murein biosynthesis integral membrane protein MurJ [Brachybacterium sacelli]|uniref:Peptidoglycan lipid II flippase n=1 Tax=Brachybacterium sacelli TaxID=173364 RepID=A0ABS4X272_9MICO|nr:lipid II flippase MurJ [Brachybacterium sacelli]MBP2382558.1 putative peptidoglycan lipid II flippase [Brachybacterium sacelli]
MTAGDPALDDTPARSGIARAVLRGAGLILVITVLARIAGFVRYLVFGASVGAGDVGTAYTTANLLPNVLFEIVAGGALAAVVVPLIAGLVPERDPAEHPEHPEIGDDTVEPDGPTHDEHGGRGHDEREVDLGQRAGAHQQVGPAASDPAASRPQLPRPARDQLPPRRDRRDGSERADRIISALLTWTLLGTGLLTAVVVVSAEGLAGLLLSTEDTSAGSVHLGAVLLRIFALQLPLYGISVVLGAYLQARKRFLWPAMMPLISSLVVIASYRVYAWLVPPVATTTTIDDPAIAWLGWGTTAGVAAMTVPVLIAALRSGLHLRPTLSMPPRYGRKALALGGAGLGAVGAQQLVLALVLVLAMRAGGTGTLPVFQYAQALYLLPYAVLVVPLVTAVFPHLSELRLVGDTTGFARVSAASTRTVMVVGVIGAATLFAAAPALEQFFRLIDRAGASGVGSTAAALALGLPGYAVAIQCTRILSAALRARDALLVGSVGWGVAAVAILVLVIPSPTRSPAEASTAFGITIAIGMALSALVGLARIADILEPGGDLPRVRRTAILTPLALVVGGVPGMLLGKWLVTTGTGEIGAVASGVLCGLVAAVLASAVMAAADPVTTRDLLRRARRRCAASDTDPAASSDEDDAWTGDASTDADEPQTGAQR